MYKSSRLASSCNKRNLWRNRVCGWVMNKTWRAHWHSSSNVPVYVGVCRFWFYRLSNELFSEYEFAYVTCFLAVCPHEFWADSRDSPIQRGPWQSERKCLAPTYPSSSYSELGNFRDGVAKIMSIATKNSLPRLDIKHFFCHNHLVTPKYLIN